MWPDMSANEETVHPSHNYKSLPLQVKVQFSTRSLHTEQQAIKDPKKY